MGVHKYVLNKQCSALQINPEAA